MDKAILRDEVRTPPKRQKMKKKKRDVNIETAMALPINFVKESFAKVVAKCVVHKPDSCYQSHLLVSHVTCSNFFPGSMKSFITMLKPWIVKTQAVTQY